METIKVYQSETDEEIEMEVVGRLRYVGNTISIQLKDGVIYTCVGIDGVDFFRIVDDEGEDYLYPIDNPRAFDSFGVTKEELLGGKWEIVEDPTGALKKALDFYTDQ